MRSDFITVAIHAHQFHDAKGGYRGPGIPEAEHLDTNPSIADFLELFAKAVIDGGADLFGDPGERYVLGVEDAVAKLKVIHIRRLWRSFAPLSSKPCFAPGNPLATKWW